MDQHGFIHRKSTQTSKAHRQLSSLVETAAAQPDRMYRDRYQNRLFVSGKKVPISPDNGLCIKIQLFPPVFIFDRRQRFLGHVIVAVQGNARLKTPVPPFAVRAVLLTVTDQLRTTFFAGWLPDKKQLLHTARAD